MTSNKFPDFPLPFPDLSNPDFPDKWEHCIPTVLNITV